MKELNKVVYLSEIPPEQYEMFSAYKDLLTVDDIAEITGKSKQSIRRLFNQGLIPGVQIGRRWFSPKSQFIKYVEKGNSY